MERCSFEQSLLVQGGTLIIIVLLLISFNLMLLMRHMVQWRRKVAKSVCVCVCVRGGGGTQTRNLCTFGKEPI